MNDKLNIRCPVITCGAVNEYPVTICVRCGADLRAYSVSLKFADICFNRALYHATSGNFLAAKQELHTCLLFNPQDEEAQLILGKTYYWAANEKQAAKRIWETLAENGSNPEIRRQASACLQAASVNKNQRKSTRKHSRKGKRKKMSNETI